MTKEEIKQARAELGLTQTRLAAAMGVNTRKVERWESGTSPISPEGQTLLTLLLEQHRSKQGE